MVGVKNLVLWTVLIVSWTFLAAFTSAVIQADQSNQAVPAVNGTSNQTNVTGLMEQYVGFYGTVTMEVRRTSAAGNVLYNRTVASGYLYFVENGASLTFATVVGASVNDSNTDSNFSLSGYYITANHFTINNTHRVCGQNFTWHLNTTDNYAVGIFCDSRNATTGAACNLGASNYFFCTDVRTVSSSNGFGTVQYELVVVKTALYQSYDIYFDLLGT